MQKSLGSILILLWGITAGNGEVTISKLENIGAYCEDVGEVHFFQSTWNILTKITWEDHGNQLWTLEKGTWTLSSLCRKLGNQQDITNCLELVREITTHLNTVKDKNQLLNRLYRKVNYYRKKRGLVNIVGKGIKWLFGNMDSDDEQKITEKMTEIDNHEQKTFNLVKEQITVTGNNLDTIRNATSLLNNEVGLVANRLNNMTELVEKFRQDVYGNIQRINVNEHVNTLVNDWTLKLLEIREAQDLSISVITELRHGQLHPALLSTQDVTEILKELTSELGETLVNEEVLSQVYELQYFIEGGTAMVKIGVPIINPEVFRINKIVLLPFPKQQTTNIYNLGTELVAATIDKTKFYFLTKEELTSCKVIKRLEKDDLRVCEENKPVYGYDSRNCIMSLMHNPFEEKINCPTVRYGSHNNFLTKLKNNSVLYYFEDRQNLKVREPKLISEISLAGQGILTCTTGCEINTPEFRLTIGTNKLLKNLEKTIQLRYGLINETMTESKDQDVATEQPIQVLGNDINDKLVGDSKRFTGLIEKADREELDRINERHQTTARTGIGAILIVLVIVIAIIIGIIFIYVRFRAIKSLIGNIIGLAGTADILTTVGEAVARSSAKKILDKPDKITEVTPSNIGIPTEIGESKIKAQEEAKQNKGRDLVHYTQRMDRSW